MIIYVDVIFFLNIFLDFILLMTVSVILTRRASIKRLLLGSFIGGGTTFILFINLNSLLVFILKIILGIIMVIVSFGFRDIRYTFNNLFYLFTISFSIGGVLYLLMDKGFYNYIIIVLGFIFVCFIYIKQIKRVGDNYQNYYKVELYYKNQLLKLTGYLDTGNKLYDMYKKRPIILVDKKIKYNLEDIIYVPYTSLNNESILKCLKVDKIIINGHVFHNYLMGLVDKKIRIDGINCLLHSKMKGAI